MVDLNSFNALPQEAAREALTRCCGSHAWVEAMISRRPFATETALLAAAEDIWSRLSRNDWLEAFAAHPRIGDLDALRKKFASTAEWCNREQAGVAHAEERVLQELTEANRLYEMRFGYIFIICATGKTASEMLAILKSRLDNEPELELGFAAAEQAKITRLRLEKL